MQAVVDALKAWQLHPVADHFTVAIVVVAVLADLLASLFASRLWIRYMATFLMVVGALAAWSSNVTGGWEASRVWDNVTPGQGRAQNACGIGRLAPMGDYRTGDLARG